jgi:hypothetical protein
MGQHGQQSFETRDGLQISANDEIENSKSARSAASDFLKAIIGV